MSQNLQFGDSYVACTSEPSEAEKSSDDEQRKVPALQKVVMEVMAWQKLLRFIEPIGQLSDKKRNELALEKFSTILKWDSGNEIHPSESGNLNLQFLGSICPLVFTGIPIVGEENSLQVALLDAITGEVVTSGPEASAKVEIVVIDGGFGVDEGGGWTLEEFNSKIVSGREGKKSLLGGKRYLHLKDGIGSVPEIYFKHTNVWRRSGKYRLWARVVDHSNGRRIIAAKTEPFTVKDRRGMNKKHCPPSLSDEVWRLKNIRKGGPFHKRLSEENIKTVKDFLTQNSLNRERLQEILGKSMSGKRWEATVNHAQTFKHYTSLAHHSLPSSDGLYPKNFDNPDCSNVCNFGTSDMHDHYNPTQPGTSFQGIISPILPSSPTSTLEEHGLQNNSNIDHIYGQSSSVPGNGTNSLLCDLGPLFSDWDKNNSLDFLIGT